MGSCSHAVAGVEDVFCWSNGAEATESHGPGDQQWTFAGSGGDTCFTWHHFAGGSDFTAGGSALSFEPASGDYTCGGMSGTVGANCGGCSALCALLAAPTCASGTCR